MILNCIRKVEWNKVKDKKQWGKDLIEKMDLYIAQRLNSFGGLLLILMILMKS